MMGNQVCLLDMDGVLCDFAGAALALPGLERIGEEYLKLTPEQWSHCNYDFWANLNWADNGYQILGVCEKVFGREKVFLCTSPCPTKGGLEGKREWVFNHLPEGYPERLIFCSHKYLLAGNGLLVDDSNEVVDHFREAGGVAVMVPRPWNRRRGMVFDEAVFEQELRNPVD